MEMARLEDRSSNGGVLGEGMFPFPTARGSGERCSKLPQWVRADLEFRTFYSLTKPLDFADIKFLSVKFSWGTEPQ